MSRSLQKNPDKAAEFAFNTYIQNRFLQKFRYKKVLNAVSQAMVKVEQDTAHLSETTYFEFIKHSINRSELKSKITAFKSAFKTLMHNNGVYVKICAGIAILVPMVLSLNNQNWDDKKLH